MTDVVVIGAGIAGLCCARRLSDAGADVLVLEAGVRPGGVIRSHTTDGFLIESGPNTILPTPFASRLISAAGLDSEVVTAPRGAPRFIYLGNRLRKAPWVLSPAGFLRALVEPFVGRGPIGKDGDESFSAFVTRRLGRQVHDRLAAPFVSGIWAGDPAQISLPAAFPRLAEFEARYGSLIVGALRAPRSGPRARLSSFRTGMEALPGRLSEGLEISYGAADIEVASSCRVKWAGGEAAPSAVVLAVPAWAAAARLESVDRGLAGLLASVSYAPIVVVASALDLSREAPPSGFGFLVPRTEGLKTLGTLFNSSLFAGRAPEGKALLTTFIGGATAPEIVDWSDEQVGETVDSELTRVLGLSGGIEPLRMFRYRRAIPQYRLGHRAWRQDVLLALKKLPGVFLTGNYLDGVSVTGTMERGHRTGDAVLDYIGRSKLDGDAV